MEIDISHIHIANCYCTETDSSLVRVAKADSFIISGAAISGATEDGDSSFVSGRGVEIEGCVRGSVTNSKFTGLVVKCTGFSGGSYEEAGGGGLKATVKATGVTGRSMEKSGNGDASDIRTEEEEAQLAIEGCQFERCKVIGAGKEKALLVGGGVWCVLGKKDDGAGEGGRIEIKGCMFKSCWAGEKKDETGMAEDANNTEGRGGGIFLDVQNTNMKFYLGGVTKENEEGDTEGPMAGKKNLFGVGERDECYALHGRNLFVRYPVANASEIVEKIRFDFEYDTESAKGRHEMEGGYFREDTEGEGEKTIREETESLLRYLVDWDESEGAYVMMGKKEKEIEVGGEDVLGCGRKYLPCVKIDYAYENAGWDVSSDEAKIVLSGANYAIKAPIELLAGNGANGALPGKVIIDGAAGSEDGSAEKMKVMIDIESKPGVSGRNEGEEGDAKGAITSHVNLVIQNVYFSLNKAGNKSSSVVWSEGAGVSLSVEHVEFDGAEISEETIGWRVIHYEGGSNLSMSDVTVKAMKLSKSMIEYEYGVSSQVAEGGGEGGGEVANKVNLVDVWMNDCKVNGGNGGKAYLVKVEAGEGVSVNMEEVTITKSVSEEGCGSLVRVAKADSFIISGAAISGATEDGDSSFVSGRGVEIEGCVRGSVTNSKFTGLVVKCTGFSGGSYEEAGGGDGSKGGGMYVHNLENLPMKMDMRVSDMNNCIDNKAIFGSVMFLYAKDLSEIVKSTTFNFLASGANIDEFLGSELINDPDVDAVPLFAFTYVSLSDLNYQDASFMIAGSGTHGGCIAMKKLNDNQQDQSLNFSQVRFSNVNVDGSESQGGSMYLALDNKMKLLINNSAFSSSSANLSNGRGGALLLNLLPPFVGSYLLSSPTFKFNSAKCGRDVFVYATRLSTGAVMSWFDFSFFDGYDQKNALYGADALDSKDVNLFDLWEQKSSVVVIADDGIDSKLCGTTSIPCKSFSDALSRLEGDDKYIQIDGKCYITSSNDVSGTTIQPHNEDSSQSPGTKQITLVLKGNESIEITTGLLCNSKFFALQNASLHITRELACGAVIKSTEGHAHLTSIELTYEEADQTANALLKRSTNDPFQIAMNILLIEGGDLTISEFRMNGLAFAVSPIVLNQNCGNISISSMTVDDTIINDIESSFYSIADPNERYNSDEKINFSLSHSSFSNLSRGLSVESLAKLKSVSQCFPLIYSQFDDLPLIGNPQADIFEKCPTIDIGNCSFNCFEDNCNAPFIGISKSVTSISFSTFNAGLFSNSNSRLLCDKSLNELNSFSELQSNASINNNPEQFSSIEDICGWNGSMMELKKSEVFMKETAFINGKNGGLSVVGGKVRIEMGIYSDNNPKIEKYESLRRNIICKNAAELELVSLKDGDGLKDDSSLWILNEGCTLGGIAGKRASPLFTPHLESVTASSQGQDAQIELKGKLLIPCNLSLQFTLNRSDGHHIVKEILEKEYSIDEKNIRLTVQLSSLGWDEKTTEASVCVLFGNAESPSETISFILQNSTEANSEISNNETESPKKGKLEWSIIAFIACVVIIVIMIIAFIILAVLYRKKQSISKMPFIEIDSEKVKLEEAEEMKREDSKITKETNDISSTLLEKKQSQGPQRIGINDISIPIEPENFCIETIQQVDGFDKSMPADSVISIIDSPFPVISDEIMHLVIDSSPSPSQKKRGKKRGKKREKGKLRKGKKAKSLQKKVEDIESVEDDNCFSEETNGPQ
ncbi:uncharacterized protein MONOS_9739 [Monocercomonoides exilis]|uniref:uncharacterized protein n=1 Tax=Monocercomonoides exilis TaxID=2049356 RepID=UPI003559ECD1|nr:hypothetical protein MONOS_9739 [Monocercomonoides exilis]|eukprot:MONOS_9739.1-p1 / transcript=MONOS_9739.1 / gene=MONOS_9739 / organism=Monocercomonoides_exilis_PA203 / gene_product=unspecified product / transcript_product=unspecified product / location=Mono_scaffold00414:16581-22757(+) / protein_length=1729 / sequence_SO=supercontig / SO=protein_coding / is_pseudo=false